VEDGYAMVAAAQKGKRILQAGSQRVSSVLYRKAKEIYDSGRLGDVYSIDAHWDRNTASGAWVYPVPPNASEQTIDWNGFLAGAPKRPFDPVRFFRWRCYKDYGEGLAGDLFVHLVSGIHFVTGTNEVAKRAQASGGIYRWKDGREFPDLIQSLYDYPKFQVALRCNLNNETGEFIAFYGTKGSLVIKDATLTFTPQDTRPQPEGYSIIGWPAELRKQYLAQWGTEHPAPAALASNVDQEAESYALPPQYSDTVDHLANFFSSVRTRKEPVENGDFGNNAAIACHLANYSYFNKTVATWDAENKKIKS
jgi:predicted dehydrogenase